MYRKCTVAFPLLKLHRAPVSVHGRNIFSIRPVPVIRNVLRDLERELNSFEREFENIASNFRRVESSIAKEDSSYSVNIDVENFTPDNIKISLKDRILKIEANIDQIAEDGSRLQQSMVREFTLPPNVEPSSVKSQFHDGILRIQADVNNTKKITDIPVQHLNGEETSKSKV